MSLYRKSCRITERVAMKKMYAQGVSINEISRKLRVDAGIVTDVIEGKWDATEKQLALEAMKRNQEKLAGKADEEANKVAQIAAAAAAAIQGQSPVVNPEALRAQIEAEVRAEMEAEKPKRKRRTKAEMDEQKETESEEAQSAA